MLKLFSTFAAAFALLALTSISPAEAEACGKKKAQEGTEAVETAEKGCDKDSKGCDSDCAADCGCDKAADDGAESADEAKTGGCH